jgi:hypothetical protein
VGEYVDCGRDGYDYGRSPAAHPSDGRSDLPGRPSLTSTTTDAAEPRGNTMSRYDRLLYFDRLCELREGYLVAGDADRSPSLLLLGIDGFVQAAWANAEALALAEYLADQATPTAQPE